MKIGLLGLIHSDLSDVHFHTLKPALDLGFHAVGAHLSVGADSVTASAAAAARRAFEETGLHFMQLWGPYPSIITPDETARRAGVAGAQAIVRLAAQMGVKESGVRPTSLSARGDWVAHPGHYLPETEDRLVRSLSEIAAFAADHGVDIVLETHITSALNTPETIARVIARTGAANIRINLDPCNFVGDLHTAFYPQAMLNHLFDVLAPHIATVHLKDYLLEDRLVVHISETVIGTGLMDFETILTRLNAVKPDALIVIEHLPINLIPLAKRNLDDILRRMGLHVG
jgi:sugar phosphate isomerase/epimerase